MSTFGTMITRIGVETGFSQTGYTGRISDAIKDAIDHFERRPFWFNQGEASMTLSTTVKYTIPTPKFFKITGFYIIDSSQTYSLAPCSIKEIEGRQGNTSSRPTYYAVFNDTIHLDSTPDKVYGSKIIGFVEGATASATTDTSHWFVEAEVMIRNYAKAELYNNYVLQEGNTNKKQQYYARALAENAEHRKQTNRLLSTGYLKAWG